MSGAHHEPDAANVADEDSDELKLRVDTLCTSWEGEVKGDQGRRKMH